MWDDVIALSLNESTNNPSANITFNYSYQTSGGGTYAYSNDYARNFGISRPYDWLNSVWQPLLTLATPLGALRITPGTEHRWL